MIILSTMMLLGFGLGEPPAPVGEPAEVRVLERKLTKAWREHTSITCKMKEFRFVEESSVAPVPPLAPTKAGTWLVEGTRQELRKGERILYHVATSSILIRKNKQPDPYESNTWVAVCDGKNVYRY